MDDHRPIEQRLREDADSYFSATADADDCWNITAAVEREAADEIDRLRADLAEAERIIHKYASEGDFMPDDAAEFLHRPAHEAPAVNQCDGCRAGVPVDANGNHRMGAAGKYADLMRCTADRYAPKQL